MLQLEGVQAFYGKSHVLHGVDLEVEQGEVVGLLGRNGVGKSTTLKTIMGLVTARQGRITFEGHDLRRQKPYHIPRLGIGYVPEDRRIFPRLTVFENLRTGFDRDDSSPIRVRELLDQVYTSFPRLKERQRQLAGTLSGGEQQMLAIARAMMLDPKIILLDEPTEGLMPRLVGQIREIIEVLQRARVAILLVEQNVPMTLAVSDRVYLMERGAVQFHAPAAELSIDHEMVHKYLGV
jgi:branched-chain amino acid transport system ATP-binding protein